MLFLIGCHILLAGTDINLTHLEIHRRSSFACWNDNVFRKCSFSMIVLNLFRRCRPLCSVGSTHWLITNLSPFFGEVIFDAFAFSVLNHILDVVYRRPGEWISFRCWDSPKSEAIFEWVHPNSFIISRNNVLRSQIKKQTDFGHYVCHAFWGKQHGSSRHIWVLRSGGKCSFMTFLCESLRIEIFAWINKISCYLWIGFCFIEQWAWIRRFYSKRWSDKTVSINVSKMCLLLK